MKPILPVVVATLASLVGCTRVPVVTGRETELEGDTQRRTCEPPRTKTYFSYGERGMESRVVDRHRCGVVEFRVIDSFDIDAGTHTRTVLRDRDHDGAFERRQVRVRPLEGRCADLAHGRASPAPYDQDLPARTIRASPRSDGITAGDTLVQ
jgi:hypothetical protein